MRILIDTNVLADVLLGMHERDRKGSADTTQKIEIYFNFIGEYIPPTMADLPIVSGRHLRKISDRTALQLADNAEKFITTRNIDSFESLANFTEDREQKYQQLETVHLSKGQKLNRLKELSKMYALFAPIQAT